MTQVTEGTATALPLCPACPPQPCMQSPPYPPFSQDLWNQHEEKGEVRGTTHFQNSSKELLYKWDWGYKRYSWQLTLLCWNNEIRVVEAGYLKWALLVFFIRAWVGEGGWAALPRALFLSLDSFFVLEVFFQGVRNTHWLQVTPRWGEEDKAQRIKGSMSTANLIV